MPNFKLKQFCKNRNSKNKCLTLIFRRFIHQVIAMERKKDKFSSVEHFNFIESQKVLIGETNLNNDGR